MDGLPPEDLLRFLTSPWSNTHFTEFRIQGRLAAVTVSDRLERGLSAVYTFFDPDLGRQSLGTFAILWQIDQAKNLGLPSVYLGYWIAECRKMNYKDRFRPIEAWPGKQWKRFSAGEPIRL